MFNIKDYCIKNGFDEDGNTYILYQKKFRYFSDNVTKNDLNICDFVYHPMFGYHTPKSLEDDDIQFFLRNKGCYFDLIKVNIFDYMHYDENEQTMKENNSYHKAITEMVRIFNSIPIKEWKSSDFTKGERFYHHGIYVLGRKAFYTSWNVINYIFALKDINDYGMIYITANDPGWGTSKQYIIDFTVGNGCCFWTNEHYPLLRITRVYEN